MVPVRSAARAMVGALFFVAPTLASAQVEAKFERPPVLRARDLVSERLLKWTERVASFATNPDFLATRERTLLIRGTMSPRARTELAANGWTVPGGADPMLRTSQAAR